MSLEKLQLKGKGSLKTLVTKRRGYEKFSLSIKISSGPLPAINNDCQEVLILNLWKHRYFLC